ncbi:glycerophosphodiester phosphodiesterase [Miltoncostaea oceani]|uniref:glycerophosphodiester phosphodiesterase n=1 Tax=Miltoncostaea oceani TaxID=2843216 RepID=UPI001C3E2379|nr:glycerophosphodiester phosphodiesterase [Miltoncostaea oceani]
MTGGPLLIAHRAGNDPAGVAPAVAAGADVIEIDVHMTGGRLEVRHPRRAGPILWDRAGVAWAARRRLPRLEEVLERMPPGSTPMLDLKQGPARLAPAALAACRDRGFAEVTVASRRWELVDALRDAEGVRVVHSAAGARELARLLRRPGDLRPRVVCARRDLLGEEPVRAIRAHAGTVMTWPVDDAGDAARLAAWGVGGLICDDLGLIARLAARRRR